MINYMQSNQDRLDKCKVVDDQIWEQLSINLKNNNNAADYINFIEENYDIDIRNIVKDYLNYVIRKNNGVISSDFLTSVSSRSICKILKWIILKIIFFQM